MRILLQRVSRASVAIEGNISAAIDEGVLLLVGFCHDDIADGFERVVNKIAHLRIFPDENDRLHYSIVDIQGEILVVPQFTLYASTDRGRRPDFVQAMHPQAASGLFDQLVACFNDLLPGRISTGTFGADMQVSLVNNGPLTLQLEY